jgi:hypothetical protein
VRRWESIEWIRERSAESRELKWAFIVMAVLAGATFAMWLSLAVNGQIEPTESLRWLPTGSGLPAVDTGDAGNPVESPSATADSEGGMSPLAAVAIGITLVAFLLLMAFGLYAIYSIFRRRGPKFSELSGDEQRRRKDAAALLRHIDEPKG